MLHSFEDFRAKRKKALDELDLTYFRDGRRPEQMRNAEDEVLHIVAHKMRYICVDCDPERRRESARWLLKRGWPVVLNFPVDPDVLPE